MNGSSRRQIIDAHRLRGRALEPAATEGQFVTFEAIFGPIPPDVRWYLETCGGGLVGDERLDGVQALALSHRRFLQGPWVLRSRDVFLLGWDATGGPIALERPTGRVLVEDGFFGGILQLAASFEIFLLDGLVQGRRRWTHRPGQPRRGAGEAG